MFIFCRAQGGHFKFIFRGLRGNKIIYISAVAGRRSHGALARTSYPEGLWVPSSCVMELCLLAGMTQVEPRETPRLIYMRLMVTYQHRSNGSNTDSTDKATLARLAMKQPKQFSDSDSNSWTLPRVWMLSARQNYFQYSGADDRGLDHPADPS